MLHAEQCAEHIGIKGRGVALGGLLRYRTGFAFRPGGVDGRVEAAETGDGLIDQSRTSSVMTNVGLDVGGFGIAAAKFCFECFAFRLPAASDDDARALLGEGDSGGATDAGQRTCDQDDGAAHGPSPPWRLPRSWQRQLSSWLVSGDY